MAYKYVVTAQDPTAVNAVITGELHTRLVQILQLDGHLLPAC